MKVNFAGPPFRATLEALAPPLDPTTLRVANPELLPIARAVWAERVRTEFRSIQVMTRFLQEVVSAGDPMDVYPSAAQAVMDEIRHAAFTTQIVRLLGAELPDLPEPLPETLTTEFLALPMVQRALITAISVAINETISVALIADLHGRCDNPPIHTVLAATIADEAGHGDLGWSYVGSSLQRFNEESRKFWKAVTKTTLDPHLQTAERILAQIPESERSLEHWPEPQLANLGLMSAEREALVFERTWKTVLAPRLHELGLI